MRRRKMTKSEYQAGAVISIGIWLILLWLRTFVYYMCFENTPSNVFQFLFPAVFTVIATLFVWYCCKAQGEYASFREYCKDEFGVESIEDTLDDFLDELIGEEDAGAIEDKKKWSTLQKSMCVTAILTFVSLLILVLEVWMDITVFIGGTYIKIGTFIINKKYLFDPVLLFLPMWFQLIFREMRKEDFKWKSVFLGSTQIIILSFLSFFLFMGLPNIWCIEMAFLQIVTVIVGIRKYCWNRISKKGTAVMLVLLYVFFWMSLLLLFYHPGETFAQFTFGNDWKEYQQNVFTLVRGASPSGTSIALKQNVQIIEFLKNRNNYLLAALYYGGWKPVDVIIVLLLFFLISTRRMLGQHAAYNRSHLVYEAAWWNLAIRILWGIPYSFGLLPFPIALPFAGEIALYMDSLSFGLLLWSAIEAYYIDQSVYEDCKITDLFKQSEIEIIEEDTEEDLVRARSGKKSYKCIAEEMWEYDAMVLRSVKKQNCWVLILSKDEKTGKWKDFKDDETRKLVLKKYIEKHGPDYMEVLK